MVDRSISQLPRALLLDGTERVHVSVPDGAGGYNSRRSTTGAIAALSSNQVAARISYQRPQGVNGGATTVSDDGFRYPFNTIESPQNLAVFGTLTIDGVEITTYTFTRNGYVVINIGFLNAGNVYFRQFDYVDNQYGPPSPVRQDRAGLVHTHVANVTAGRLYVLAYFCTQSDENGYGVASNFPGVSGGSAEEVYGTMNYYVGD